MLGGEKGGQEEGEGGGLPFCPGVQEFTKIHPNLMNPPLPTKSYQSLTKSTQTHRNIPNPFETYTESNWNIPISMGNKVQGTRCGGQNNQNIPDLTAFYWRPTKTNQNLAD